MDTVLAQTRDALGGAALPDLQSRSLRLTRYADPTLKNDERRSYLAAVTKADGQRQDDGLNSWRAWLDTVARPEQLLHAKLEARLLINMGGTVLENAGLQLDRFGTAYVPGSAVKGCARRTALAALREWCEEGSKPAGDDLLAPVVEPFGEPQELLLAILRVFGCTELEWQGHEKDNDLAWACGERWPEFRGSAQRALLASLGYSESSMRESLSVSGGVSFLPAYPYRRPSSDLELDVLASHHQVYYSKDDPNAIALDNEPPVPVYFPAVAAGATYTFAVLPLRKANSEFASQARSWLLLGLETFGLGAKTNAGYGWFRDATDETWREIEAEAARRRKAAEEAAEENRRRDEREARKAREAARASMSPDEIADADLSEIVDDWGKLKAHLANFSALTDFQKAALIRWFTAADQGRKLWLEQIRPMQGKAKDRKLWKQIQPLIYTARKQLKLPPLP